jgi:hypothetical protein
MAQAVSLRPLTSKVRVRNRLSLCGVCGEQSDTGTDFSQNSSLFPCEYVIIPPWLSMIIYHLGINKRHAGCHSSETSSHAIDMKKNNKSCTCSSVVKWHKTQSVRFSLDSIALDDIRKIIRRTHKLQFEIYSHLYILRTIYESDPLILSFNFLS